MSRKARQIIKSAIEKAQTLDKAVLIAYISEALMGLYVDGKDPDMGDQLDMMCERMGMSTTWDIADRIDEFVDDHENWLSKLGLI